MKSLFLSLLATLAFGTTARADLAKCDLGAVEAQLDAGIRNALDATFELNHEAAPTNLVIARAPNLVVDRFGTKTSYEALTVRFTSPRGTAMSLRSFDMMATNENHLVAFPSLAFSFRVDKERDSEGFLSKKTCRVFAGTLDMTLNLSPGIINEVNGQLAPLTDILHTGYYDRDGKRNAIDYLDLALPMTLTE